MLEKIRKAAGSVKVEGVGDVATGTSNTTATPATSNAPSPSPGPAATPSPVFRVLVHAVRLMKQIPIHLK